MSKNNKKNNDPKEKETLEEEVKDTEKSTEDGVDESEEQEYTTSKSSADLLADVLADESDQPKQEDEEKADSFEDENDEDEPDEKGKKKKKKKRTHKKLKHSVMATIYTIVFAAVVVLVNIIATIIFDKYPITFDLTSSNKYSISDESKEYVESIDVDVTVRIFATEDAFTSLNDYTQQANEVLKRYAQYNSRISIEYIDVDSNPDIVSEYTDEDVTDYSIIVETDSLDEDGNVMTDDDGDTLKRVRSVALMDLIEFDDDFEEQMSEYYGTTAEDYMLSYCGDDVTAFAYSVSYGIVQASTADEAFISALMAVTDPDPVVVYILTGRNEVADTSYLEKLLLANGYTVSELDITSEEIPEDADLCVIGAPQSDYMDAEITKIDEFLNNDGAMGKNLIYISSYAQQETPNLDEFLEEYYIEVGEGVICENDSEHYYTSAFYTVTDTMSDTFSDGLADSGAQLLSYASRPITLTEEEKGMFTTEALIQSTTDAYVADTETGEAMENGQQTYVALSSKATFTDDGGADYSNILVVGSAEMLSSTYLKYNQYQNREYFLNVINGMTGKTSTGITIEPKVISGNIFDITAQQIKVLQIVFIGVIPVVTLAIGLIIWIRRRNR
ncbi:MAG: GldG family protein [Ruminococcus sp.]|nr:GldG family protein [Ruminococcus sp.]